MIEIGNRYRLSDLIDMGYSPAQGGFVNHQNGEKALTVKQGNMLRVIKIEKM